MTPIFTVAGETSKMHFLATDLSKFNDGIPEGACSFDRLYPYTQHVQVVPTANRCGSLSQPAIFLVDPIVYFKQLKLTGLQLYAVSVCRTTFYVGLPAAEAQLPRTYRRNDKNR